MIDLVSESSDSGIHACVAGFTCKGPQELSGLAGMSSSCIGIVLLKIKVLISWIENSFFPAISGEVLSSRAISAELIAAMSAWSPLVSLPGRPR